MNFYTTTALINAVVAFIFGLSVLLKNRKSATNQTFSLFCFFVTVWSFSYFLWQISDTMHSALFWSRVLMMGAIFVPVSYLHFTFHLTGKARERKKFIIIGYLIFLFFFLANFTSYFVERVEPKLNFQFWPVPGVLFHPFLIIWFFYALYTVYLLFVSYKKSFGISKNQLRYVLLGTIIGYLGGVTNYLLWYDILVPPVGNWTAVFYLGIVAYTIIRYRLMDIRFVFGRGAVYFLSFGGVLSMAFALMYLNEKWIKIIPFNVTGAAVIILSVVLFEKIFRFFEMLASKYFYYTFYSYQTVLTDLGRRLTQVLDLDRLCNLIIVTLMDTMKLDRSVILLKNSNNEHYSIQKNVGFQAENGISLVEGGFLTEFLQKTQTPLVYEEISLISADVFDQTQKEKWEALKKNMKKIEAGLCLPLLSENKIFGMIVLGNKISKDPYSSQDIDLLENLGNQASVAIQNAKLYSEIKRFNIKLESEVEKRTKELQAAYDELQKLDKAKSEFLSIASHQLRTPLTAIKGYISMILENTFGQPTEKMQRPLENIYTSNERLIKLVNDLLNISRIEAGRLEMKPEETDLAEMINSIFEELKPTTQMRKITLKLEKPPNQSKHGTGQAEKSLPKIVIDADKIRQVLMNIVDNAIRYTKKGGITIRTSLHKNAYQIKITDTGEGMTKEDIGDLFDSFSRGRAGNKLWTEGMGLGLYVAKKFVDLHKGKIWAESKGKGKGSTFFVELPIVEI